MYRFLFSSKWLGYLLLAAVFATACVFLVRWQMDRRAETLAEAVAAHGRLALAHHHLQLRWHPELGAIVVQGAGKHCLGHGALVADIAGLDQHVLIADPTATEQTLCKGDRVGTLGQCVGVGEQCVAIAPDV